MDILVVNGSPKGAESVTLQTALYLEKKHPEHRFRYLHAGQTVRALEKDFAPAKAAVEAADMLLFCYPVYTFLVPSQLHRFIELAGERGVRAEGKWAAQISTSKHFYDVTAHGFIRENCRDLGMRYLDGLSADMEDLLTERGRAQAEQFFDRLIFAAEHDLWERPPLLPEPGPLRAATVPEEAAPAERGDVVILTDAADGDENLRRMILRFQRVLPRRTRVVNIRDIGLRGGCVSCFRCAAKGECVYTDGFDTFLREKIQTAEAVVTAFTVRGHSMGSLFKMYDDRQFCNGHRTVSEGTPFGYLVSGHLSREENLRLMLRGRAGVGGNFLAGIATDERDPDGEIDRLALSIGDAVRRRYCPPRDFLGVGGMKIFRDLIWQMQGLMRADHRFFKAHGQYDFPQKRRGRMWMMYPVGWMMRSKKLQKKLGGRMSEGMLMPYRKVLEAAGKDRK